MLVSVKSLKSALLCVADHRDIRHYLHDVFVDGKSVVATNGHIAFIERLENPEASPIITRIPHKILSGFLKTVDKDEVSVYLSLDMDGKTIIMTSKNSQVSFPQEIYYVSYNVAFNASPMKSATEQVKVNLDYINTLNKINKIIRKNKAINPLLNFNGECGMLHASWESHPQYTFYVMPLRG